MRINVPNYDYTIIGAAVLINNQWWWVEAVGDGPSKFKCSKDGVVQEFHEDEFEEVI